MNNIVLLHSDIPKGMKSYGPKGLVPIGRQQIPLIIQQIRNIRKAYLTEKYTIHIVLGFDQEKILHILDTHNENSNINIIEHTDYIKDNPSSGFIYALKHIDSGNVLIMQNGVLLSNYGFSSEQNQIPICRKCNHKMFDISARLEGSKVQYLFYDLDYEWPEIVSIASRHYVDIQRIILESGSVNKSMFLFEHINHIIDIGIEFESKVIHRKQIKKIINHKKIC